MVPDEEHVDLTTLAGYLRKSHASMPFAEQNRLRFFVSVGFNVSYYKNTTRRKLCGHFDLRNVVEIAPVPESVAPDAIGLLIAEGFSTNVRKHMIISFEPEPQSKARWLAAWTSAISAGCVHPSLLPYGSEELAVEFDDSFSRQRTVSSRRNLLSVRARGTQALTPREEHRERNGGLLSVVYDVTVPAGAKAGDVLKMKLDDGQDLQIVVPPDALPGDVLDFELPNASMMGMLPSAAASPTPEGGSSSDLASLGAASGRPTQKCCRFGPDSTAASALTENLADGRLKSGSGQDAAVTVLQARVRGMQARSMTQGAGAISETLGEPLGRDEAVRGMKSRGRTPRGGEQDMHSQRFARLELVTERLEVTAKRDVDDFERSERAEAESSLRATAGAPAVASSTSKVEDDSSSRCRVS